MPTVLSLRLPEDLLRLMDTEAGLQGCNRSRLARQAIEEYLHRIDRERRLQTMAQEMQAAYGNPQFQQQALESAESALDDGLGPDPDTPAEAWRV